MQAGYYYILKIFKLQQYKCYVYLLKVYVEKSK